MKLWLLFYTVSLLLLAANCSEKQQNNEEEIVPQSVKIEKPLNNYLPDVPLNECIHNALYYLGNTEINSYDNIDTLLPWSVRVQRQKNYSNSHAIPVNAVKDIDPSHYAYKIQQIETSI